MNNCTYKLNPRSIDNYQLISYYFIYPAGDSISGLTPRKGRFFFVFSIINLLSTPPYFQVVQTIPRQMPFGVGYTPQTLPAKDRPRTCLKGGILGASVTASSRQEVARM